MEDKRDTGEIELQIGGMTCVRCASAVEHALKGVPAWPGPRSATLISGPG